MADRIQRIFLFLALTVPLCLVLGRAVADIMMGVVSLGFIAHTTLTRDWSWLKKPWVKAALVTWAYLVLCGLLADYDTHSAIKDGMTWGRFPLFAIAFGTWLLPLDRNYKWLRISLVAVLGFVAVDTLVQFFTYKSLSGHPIPEYPGRLSGPFNRLVVGVFLARLAMPAIGLLFSWGQQQKNMLLRYGAPLCFIVLIGVTILLSGERAAFLSFLCSIFVFWLFSKHLRLAMIPAVAVAIMIGVSAATMLPSFLYRMFQNTESILTHFDQSPYGLVFGDAITAWKSSPITGVGLNNFYPACENGGAAAGYHSVTPWLKNEFHCARHAHSLYLEWLAETGLIGFTCLGVLIFFWLRQAWQTLRTTSGPHYFSILGFATGLVPLITPGLMTMSFFSNWSAVLFWWVLGLALTPRPHDQQ